jgi:hypothetical protein
MKLHNQHVRLPDGREGYVAGSGIDGLTVIVDARIVHAAASTVTVIPPPAAPPLPEPVRTAKPMQTSHERPIPFPSRPQGLSVLVSEKWSEPQ